ncbi:CHAD domain-containing protein [uncultured Ferrimonas sp.]|uniref:CHAD domain-containing protein n=1 Tax=uncultured Ferrimonas sp. TaxID=432640 RepID=UPI00263715E7|nr:CHAD domain-containing protein [uncultured Ferrimonas sp.]
MTEGLVAGICARVRLQYHHALAQLAAVEKGEDIEALHRYRVSLRKSRCLLDLFIEQLWQTPACAMSASMAQQARVTNRLRDIDVFVHSLEQNDLQIHLLQLRKQEQQQMLVQLKQLEREQLLCQALLGLKWPRNEMLLTECVSMVSEGLRQSIVNRCEVALASNKSKHWHKVRLLIKKQRYLADLCLPQGRSGHAQEWQDRLGQFNDSCTQLTLLHSLTELTPNLEVRIDGHVERLQQLKQSQKCALVQLCQQELAKKDPFGLLVEKNR